MKPQAFGAYFSKGGSCALGSAAYALGGDAMYRLYETFELPQADWRATVKRMGTCCPDPSCDNEGGVLIIPHLNDDHRWTRERIADFVELHELEALGIDSAERQADCPEVRR
jgi:hypothetical protein